MNIYSGTSERSIHHGHHTEHVIDLFLQAADYPKWRSGITEERPQTHLLHLHRGSLSRCVCVCGCCRVLLTSQVQDQQATSVCIHGALNKMGRMFIMQISGSVAGVRHTHTHTRHSGAGRVHVYAMQDCNHHHHHHHY